MKSIRELYRIGIGPSSSHTMGPHKAAQLFYARHQDDGANRFEVTLYGSLAATGKGHMTDVAIQSAIPGITILWEPHIFLPYHPNGMRFKAYKDANLLEEWVIYSVGGGAIGEDPKSPSGIAGLAAQRSFSDSGQDIYTMSTMTEILKYCQYSGKSFWEYVEDIEGKDIWNFLSEVWHTMVASVERGLDAEGVLPGPLHLRRKANTYYVKATGYKDNVRTRGLVFAYALAVAEENASGGKIVTAPTCGSSGVVPGVLYHLWRSREYSETRMVHALATAALFGNVVKENASISGADVGCQGEVGVACAMAAAAANQLFGGSVAQIEYAAEMGLEHHLGMTCDPVCGLVQIPCIERNAYAAARALDANLYATLTDGAHRVSFDRVVEVMKQTGHDLPSLYKETSEGGLARGFTQM
ncbi:MAG: L-serine ammonia-lyase [Paludibacteraceae bacterium]|nr:L-serine ammonia-lyase [Paludibacteraceae bacterium]